MKKLTVITLLTFTLLAANAAATPPTYPDIQYCTATQGPCNGTIKPVCAVNTPASGSNYDPVGDWGVNPSPHAHSEVGTTAFSPTMTLAQESAATSSCTNIPSVKDAAFWPTIFNPDGTPATIKHVGYYLGTKLFIDPTRVNDMTANGLRFRAGNPDCTSSSCAGGSFACTNANGGEGPAQKSIPTLATCTAQGKTSGVTMTLPAAGNCWNPANGLGEGLGTSNPPADIINSGAQPCPAGYIAVPAPALVVTATGGFGGYLSSDLDTGQTSPGGYSAHWDFVLDFAYDTLDSDSSLIDVIVDCLDVTNQNPPPTGTSITCANNSQGTLFPNIPGNMTNFSEPVTN
jgi:hypothetical protein